MTYYPQRTNVLALIGMITSIVGILGLAICCCSPILAAGWCGFFSIAALILGYLGHRQIAASGGTETGDQMAVVAMVLGGVELVVALLAIALFVLSLAGAFVLPTLESLFPSNY